MNFMNSQAIHDIILTLNPEDIRAHLESSGWEKMWDMPPKEPDGGTFSKWSIISGGERVYVTFLHDKDTYADYPLRTKELISTLIEVENSSFFDVIKGIKKQSISFKVGDKVKFYKTGEIIRIKNYGTPEEPDYLASVQTQDTVYRLPLSEIEPAERNITNPVTGSKIPVGEGSSKRLSQEDNYKKDVAKLTITLIILGFICASIMHLAIDSSQYDEHTWNDAYKGGYVAGISGLPTETINPKYQENYDRGYADGLRINQSKMGEDDNGN